MVRRTCIVHVRKLLLTIRDEQPELWQRAMDLGLRFYQQPAGFEDSWVTARKFEKQTEDTPVSIAVRDLFGGAFAEEVKIVLEIHNQMKTWDLGKMGCVCQITDTTVAFRLKAYAGDEHDKLKAELKTLAEAEGTRAILRCGVYDVFRQLKPEAGTGVSGFSSHTQLL